MDAIENTTSTAAPAISAEAHGTGSYPEYAVVTIGGVEHRVDVSVDRDDWQLPECADGDEVRILDALDEAVEAFLTDSFGPARPGFFARVA